MDQEKADVKDEPRKVILPSGVEITIEGPFTPQNPFPPEWQKQWDELKRTRIGPGHPDF
jgi:hypothetical protein